MNAKEKANQLIGLFFANALPDAVENNRSVGIGCAIVCVDEILWALGKHDQSDCGFFYVGDPELGEEFWQEVKTELLQMKH